MAPAPEHPHAQVASGVWESLLKEVTSSAHVPDGSLLMCGRPGIGKRTLVAAILDHASPTVAAELAAASQETDDLPHSRAVAMDYLYFGVRDPVLVEADVASVGFTCPATCSVFIMEDVKHEAVLMTRLAKFNLRHSAALICLDLKEPWTMMRDFRTWLELLRRMLTSCLEGKTESEIADLKARVAQQVSVADLSPMVAASAAATQGGQADGAVPVAKGAGGEASDASYCIPVIVVITRADGASALEQQGTIGWTDVIETSLRHACLAEGFAIVYTLVQTKKSGNVGLLYSYLMHRMYDYPFKQEPITQSPDGLFIPAGWDSVEKLDQETLERKFEEVITPPRTIGEAEVKADECEDMLVFLKKTQDVLKQLPQTSSAAAPGGHTAGGHGGSSSRHANEKGQESTKVRAKEESNSNSTAVSGASNPAAGAQNESLANFFQGLLARGGGKDGGGAPAAGAAAGGAAALLSKAAKRASAVAEKDPAPS